MPINEWKPGRNLFTCQKCGKQIWLQSDLWLKATYKKGLCIECGQSRKDVNNVKAKQKGR